MVQWATQHMQSYLPAPTTSDAEPTLTHSHDHDYAHEMAQMGQQTLQVAQLLINRETNQTDPSPHAPK